MPRKNKPTDIFKCIDLNPKPPSTCWLWQRPVNDKGLPYFHVHGKAVLAYRLVYWITHPEWDINNSREYILHSCKDIYGNAVDNPLCCNPAHLRPGTHEENMMDMMTRGRAGLTADAVRDILTIKEKFQDATHVEIANRVGAKYGITIARQTVTSILSGYRRSVMRNIIDEKFKAEKESGQ